MKTHKAPINDQQVEVMIGTLLRTGVILAAIVVLTGGGIYLFRHGYETPEHRVFHGEPQAWSTLSGIFSEGTLTHGRAIIMAGLLLLILTPIARVAFALGAFALECDWLYVFLTSIVLALLLYSLLS